MTQQEIYLIGTPSQWQLRFLSDKTRSEYESLGISLSYEAGNIVDFITSSLAKKPDKTMKFIQVLKDVAYSDGVIAEVYYADEYLEPNTVDLLPSEIGFQIFEIRSNNTSAVSKFYHKYKLCSLEQIVADYTLSTGKYGFATPHLIDMMRQSDVKYVLYDEDRPSVVKFVPCLSQLVSSSGDVQIPGTTNRDILFKWL